jgi:hypothetical protein
MALRSYAENDAQRPLLEAKADTLLRRGDRRFSPAADLACAVQPAVRLQKGQRTTH